MAQVFRAGHTGRKAICQAVWPLPQGQGGAGGRPLLHETLLLGSRNALRTTENAETQKIAIWRPRPAEPLTLSHFGPRMTRQIYDDRGRPLLHEALLLGSRNALRTTEHAENRDLEASSCGPPHGEPFRATRQHSTTRGEAPFQREGLAQVFRAGHTGRKAICQAVWPLPQGQGGAGGRPLLHERLLLGSRNALRTTEHAETQKIAIWRPRPGAPLAISHFGPPDSIRRRVGRPLSRGGAWPRFSRPRTRAGRPFIRMSGLSHRGREGQGEGRFCTKRFC